MNLIDMLPHFYAGSSEVINLQVAFGNAADELHADVLDMLNQLYVDTATWGLEYWERFLELRTDLNEPLANRRSRIKTVLRSQGTISIELLKSICASFVNGEVEIVELIADYKFQIKFVGEIGIPGNIEYIRETINKVKPAHLGFEFVYLYITHDMLKVKTHDQLALFTHDQLRTDGSVIS